MPVIALRTPLLTIRVGREHPNSDGNGRSGYLFTDELGIVIVNC